LINQRVDKIECKKRYLGGKSGMTPRGMHQRGRREYHEVGRQGGRTVVQHPVPKLWVKKYIGSFPNGILQKGGSSLQHLNKQLKGQNGLVGTPQGKESGDRYIPGSSEYFPLTWIKRGVTGLLVDGCWPKISWGPSTIKPPREVGACGSGRPPY